MHPNNPIPGFNPDAGAPIPVAEAAAWAANYRGEALTEAEVAGRKRINAYYFGNKLLDRIKNQEGCVGLRFYMGLKKSKTDLTKPDESQILVVGVDKNGHDIVPRLGANGETIYDDGIVGDMTSKCPAVCDPGSTLN
ncbi:hypothetical protein [Hymenobacter psychrophilus]|uniref:Uncharacterized protein n=1 Tax=Hymenobacter psychrophilus TaxID=651662 RepID=A0A1H3GX70_9BACT|nr:hypothetical protein [Hymenobacter psychrophilus]SDY07717.1 hypothetical protein SAMN04488069_105203 [Hymenobacter psychrophilus]